MKNISFTTAMLLLFSTFILSLSLYGQIYEWRIDSTGYMGGHLGFFHSMLENDTLHETDFIFEENNYLRWYAYKMSWQSSFTALPESTYLVKMTSIDIGDTWTSWVGEPTTAIVVDTSTITVPVGTFKTYIVKAHLKSFPDSLVFTSYFANNIGRIKGIYRGETGVLTSYTIVGGSGYYPLAIGNWWRTEPITGVESQNINIPTHFFLEENYPNPFNPNTTIKYQVPTRSHVSLKVFDVLGREVTTLVDGIEEPGYKSVNFDANNLVSGVYFYRFQAGVFIETKKLVLLR